MMVNSLKKLPKDLPEDVQSEVQKNLDGRGENIRKTFIAKLAGVDIDSLNSLLGKFADHRVKPPDVFNHCPRKDYTNDLYLPCYFAIRILLNYYNRGIFTEKGCIVLGVPIPVKPEKQVLETRKLEKSLQIELAEKLKASTEVPTEAGRIDLLTSTEIIEIKQIGQWKSALGQILVYGNYYPSHQKRIYLFGVKDCHSSYLDTIKKHCKKFDVIVTIDLNHCD